MLVAGELELTLQKNMSEAERSARIAIAKTLCYHKLYLSDAELREGYDQIMKRVERGTQDWDEALGEHLHELLNYRANVILREKIHDESGQPFTKVESKKMKEKRPTDSGYENRIIYCQDYNSGKCSARDHHEGRFSGKKVTKFHICKKCHTLGEIKSHREIDQQCPNRNA